MLFVIDSLLACLCFFLHINSLKFLKFILNTTDFHSKDVLKRTSSQNLLLMQLISNWALYHTIERLTMLVISNGLTLHTHLILKLLTGLFPELYSTQSNHDNLCVIDTRHGKETGSLPKESFMYYL